MSLLRAFLRNTAGASAAEFALVLPAFLLLLLGSVDVGRWMWWLNEVEKATQVGARHAVVTSLVAGGINEADFSAACEGTTLNVGDRIACPDAFPSVTCDDSGCSCAGGDCGPIDASTYDGAAFTAIVQRMQRIAPYLGAGDVTVTYSPSGIGYHGDPTCLGVQDKDEGCSTGELADVAPIVTVSVSSLQFRAMTFGLFPVGITIPDHSYSLPLEDGYGTAAS